MAMQVQLSVKSHPQSLKKEIRTAVRDHVLNTILDSASSTSTAMPDRQESQTRRKANAARIQFFQDLLAGRLSVKKSLEQKHKDSKIIQAARLLFADQPVTRAKKRMKLQEEDESSDEKISFGTALQSQESVDTEAPVRLDKKLLNRPILFCFDREGWLRGTIAKDLHHQKNCYDFEDGDVLPQRLDRCKYGSSDEAGNWVLLRKS